MHSLKHICGRFIHRQIIEGSMCLDSSLPRPIIQYIQGTNPYFNNCVIKSRIDVIHELALYPSTQNEFMEFIDAQMHSNPIFPYNYNLMMVHALLNNNFKSANYLMYKCFYELDIETIVKTLNRFYELSAIDHIRKLSVALISPTAYIDVIKKFPHKIKRMVNLTQELCDMAVSLRPSLFKYVPDCFKTPEICAKAVYAMEELIQYVPPALRSKKMCEYVCNKDIQLFKNVPDYLKTPALCYMAVIRNAALLKYVPLPLKNLQLCTAAQSALQHVPNFIKTFDLCKSVVKKNGLMLRYVPIYMITPSLCKLAVTENGFALAYVPPCMKTYAICKTALYNNINALSYVPKNMDMHEFYTMGAYKDAMRHIPILSNQHCISAVYANGMNLKFVPRHMRTLEICQIAVANNPNALQYVRKQFRTPSLCLAAVNKDANAIRYVYPKTPALCAIALDRNINLFMYLPKHIKTFELCKQVLAKNPTLYAYIPKKFKSNPTHVI